MNNLHGIENDGAIAHALGEIERETHRHSHHYTSPSTIEGTSSLQLTTTDHFSSSHRI